MHHKKIKFFTKKIFIGEFPELENSNHTSLFYSNLTNYQLFIDNAGGLHGE